MSNAGRRTVRSRAVGLRQHLRSEHGALFSRYGSVGARCGLGFNESYVVCYGVWWPDGAF